jgi:hypothetical protein
LPLTECCKPLSERTPELPVHWKLKGRPQLQHIALFHDAFIEHDARIALDLVLKDAAGSIVISSSDKPELILAFSKSVNIANFWE